MLHNIFRSQNQSVENIKQVPEKPVYTRTNKDATKSINKNGEKILNSDLTTDSQSRYQTQKQKMPQMVTVSQGRKNGLRLSTPEYNFKVPAYKSKLWNTNIIEGGSSVNSPNIGKSPGVLFIYNLAKLGLEKSLKKSMELVQRAKMKEQTLSFYRKRSPDTSGSKSRSQSLMIKDVEEVSDLLVDSILYKINALQNIKLG